MAHSKSVRSVIRNLSLVDTRVSVEPSVGAGSSAREMSGDLVLRFLDRAAGVYCLTARLDGSRVHCNPALACRLGLSNVAPPANLWQVVSAASARQLRSLIDAGPGVHSAVFGFVDRRGQALDLSCDLSIEDGRLALVGEALASAGAASPADLVEVNQELASKAREAARQERALRRAHKAAVDLALHDALTGLPNRLLFDDRLTQAVLRAQRDGRKFALLYLDLDKFKPVNDRYGHRYGDLLLREVAGRLRGVFRGSDTVARIGGDEFAALVTLGKAGDVGEAVMLAERLIDRLRQAYQLAEVAVQLDASIGIAIFPDHARDVDVLLQAADSAMYAAKRMGGGLAFAGGLMADGSALQTLSAAS